MEKDYKMRIDLNPGSGVEQPQSQKPELQRSSADARARGAESGPVQFETGVGKLRESALNSPEVRQAKVDALKTQLDSGTYHASNHRVAGAVLEQLRRV